MFKKNQSNSEMLKGTLDINRKAKFYRLTAEGRKQLVRETSRWRQMTRAIGLVLGEEGGA
jgi:PadR family transcriptional regulator PadR